MISAAAGTQSVNFRLYPGMENRHNLRMLDQIFRLGLSKG